MRSNLQAVCKSCACRKTRNEMNLNSQLDTKSPAHVEIIHRLTDSKVDFDEFK